MKKNGNGAGKTAGVRARAGSFVLGISLLFFLVVVGIPLIGKGQQIFANRSKAAYDHAQAQFLLQTNNSDAGWQFARACFDWADWSTNKAERADIASNGIAACERSLSLSNSAAAHYYMAMNLGQLARADRIHGLKYVDRMETEFQTAGGLDPHFNFAAPSRSLGQLYRDAPAWPVSIGSRDKARDCLEKAATLAPNYPGNLLTLGESYHQWDNDAGAKKELAALDLLWPKAHTNLTGQAWEQSWADWADRRETLRKALNP
jgi:tetratricopeptide (TPR) repeat protein